MTTAVYDNTTSRRDALRGMFATIIAGTGAAAGSADTRVITLCSQLATLQGEFDELLNRRDTIELEHATEHELAAIEAAGLPQTMLGILAIARAGLALHPDRGAVSDNSHWLLL